MTPATVKDELLEAPGIGRSLAADLHDLGVHSLRDLGREDPEVLYARLCEERGVRMDPCVLYAFRCAVYYARTPRPRPDLLQWWKWKDRRLPERQARRGIRPDGGGR
jgi:hypothetical protein